MHSATGSTGMHGAQAIRHPTHRPRASKTRQLTWRTRSSEALCIFSTRNDIWSGSQTLAKRSSLAVTTLVTKQVVQISTIAGCSINREANKVPNPGLNYQFACNSRLPFCKNWNTTVATSTRSKFLSGCHLRNSVRHSVMRASIGCTERNFINSCNASLLAFSISGLSLDSKSAAAFLSDGSATMTLLLLDLVLECLRLDWFIRELALLDERFLLLLCFFFD